MPFCTELWKSAKYATSPEQKKKNASKTSSKTFIYCKWHLLHKLSRFKRTDECVF